MQKGRLVSPPAFKNGRVKHPWKCNLLLCQYALELLQYVMESEYPSVVMPVASLGLG